MYPGRSSSRSTPGRSRGCSTNGCPWGQPALLWGEAGGDATATVRPFDPAVSAHSQPLVAARPGRGGRWRLTPQRRSRRSPAVERCPGIGSRPARRGCGSEYMQSTRTSSYRSFKVHEYYGLVTVRTNQPYQRWGCERAWPGVPGRWRPSGGNPFWTERLSGIDDVCAGCGGSGSALLRSGRVRAACRFSLGCCCWASRWRSRCRPAARTRSRRRHRRCSRDRRRRRPVGARRRAGCAAAVPGQRSGSCCPRRRTARNGPRIRRRGRPARRFRRASDSGAISRASRGRHRTPATWCGRIWRLAAGRPR